MSDHLSSLGRDGITEFEYEYLTGNETAWHDSLKRKAAWNVVTSFCRGNGLGYFGNPSERGLKEMKRYEDGHQS